MPFLALETAAKLQLMIAGGQIKEPHPLALENAPTCKLSWTNVFGQDLLLPAHPEGGGYVYMHMYMYVYAHMCIFVYIHSYMYAYIHIIVFIHTYICGRHVYV